MATDAVKKVQEKLFRGGNITPRPDQYRSELLAETPLTITIPKLPPTPNPPPKRERQSDSPRKPEETISRSHRERLASTLGDEYKGAERYRLVQDGKKEKHWKRWGPYLSDRQWVSPVCPFPHLIWIDDYVGHRTRRLLG